MYLNPIRVQRRDKYIPDLRQGVGLHIRALRNGGETTFPDKLNYTSTALRSGITTDSKRPSPRAPILKRVGGAAAIFHSQTDVVSAQGKS